MHANNDLYGALCRPGWRAKLCCTHLITWVEMAQNNHCCVYIFILMTLKFVPLVTSQSHSQLVAF
jgi:hypothetical protein